MKYFYQVINIPWVNSTVDVWQEGTPEIKTRLICLGLRHPGGYDERKLVDILKIKFDHTEVEVERVD